MDIIAGRGGYSDFLYSGIADAAIHGNAGNMLARLDVQTDCLAGPKFRCLGFIHTHNGTARFAHPSIVASHLYRGLARETILESINLGRRIRVNRANGVSNAIASRQQDSARNDRQYCFHDFTSFAESY